MHLPRFLTHIALLPLLLTGLLISQPVQAQNDQEWSDPFAAFLKDQDYVDAIGQQINLVERQIAPECVQVLAGADRKQVRLRVKPVFKVGTIWPIWGEWREQVQISRCGSPVIHNILVVARPDGAPELTSLLPGGTRASAELQIAAALPVVTIANARMGKECPTGQRDITDTAFVGYRDGTATLPQAERKWREYWQVRMCGKQLTVQVDFLPDGKGGFTHVVDLAD